ncbi:MAG: DNA-binding transcriptional ArsR family regulator [Roseivirga sp.]|jgi:DNA-binding transcriptional ArsR family regulator
MRRDVFQAIADPTRRNIVMLIAFNKINLNTIAKNFDMSRPAISQHIKILAACGLVNISQHGRERFCEVQPKKLAEVALWLEPFSMMWLEKPMKVDKIHAQTKLKERAKQPIEQLSMF